MNLVTGHDATVVDWIAKIYGAHVRHHPRMVLGIIDGGGVLRGAFVVTWHNDTSAELHVYGKISNGTVRGMFEAVFGGCGVHRLEVRTHRKHRKVRKAAPKYGFRYESVARDYYGRGQDAFVYVMTAPECRWLKGEDHGLIVQSA